MTTKNRIFDVNNCPKSSSQIIMGNMIVNNVRKGYRKIYARVLHFNHNDNDIFDKDF